MKFDINRFFMAWFMTTAFFSFYAASHSHPGALADGFESLFCLGLVWVTDHYESLNRKI